MAFNPGSLSALAEKLKGSLDHVGRRTDELNARLDRSVGGFDAALDKQHSVLDVVEQHTAAIDDFTNQISNDGPTGPLPASPATPAFVPPATLGEVPVIPPPMLSGTR